MGLNLDWFKSYGLRCSLRLHASSANSQRIATDKWPFYDHIWPSFCQLTSDSKKLWQATVLYCYCGLSQFFWIRRYMLIFHKTEIQMVILRCLTSPNLNCYKSYNTKGRKAKNTNVCFCTKLQKNGNWNICLLCHNFWTNQNLDHSSTQNDRLNLSFVKNEHTNGKKKWLEMVVKLSFVSIFHFRLDYITNSPCSCCSSGCGWCCSSCSGCCWGSCCCCGGCGCCCSGTTLGCCFQWFWPFSFIILIAVVIVINVINIVFSW